ncbi:MAG: zinc ribbon domain-containing protein [Dehalococcoidia bacterium]|nr:MAG: zinc ribbon domain-containing protein [Dehalococcoidia bacterium]
MPIYEYLCPECNHRFELLRRINQASEDASCPHCNGRAKRIISPVPPSPQSALGPAEKEQFRKWKM